MEDFKNRNHTFPLRERGHAQWFNKHIVTSCGFSWVVKELPGNWSEVAFLKRMPKGQLHQSLSVCLRDTTPNPAPQNIWGWGAWFRMFNKHDRWFCCTLHSENHWSKATCLGQTDSCWRMRGTTGEQLWVGSQIFCVKHRRLAAWWAQACTRNWIQQGVGDYRTGIVLTGTLCSPSRLRKQDSQLSAFPFLTSFLLSSCSLTFPSTCFPSEICSESWQRVAVPPSIVSPHQLARADPDSRYGQGQSGSHNPVFLEKPLLKQLTTSLQAQRIPGMRSILEII